MTSTVRLREFRSRRVVRSVVAFVFFGLLGTAQPTLAADIVSYVDSAPFPPVAGVVLPATPTAGDRVVWRGSLGRTFTNDCFPTAYSGPANVTVDSVNRVVHLSFDVAAATPSPFCSSLFAPVSWIQLELDPLPAGNWTLQVDRMLSALLLGSIAPQSVPFSVAPAAGAPVPAGSLSSLAALLVAAIGLSALTLARPTGRKRDAS